MKRFFGFESILRALLSGGIVGLAVSFFADVKWALVSGGSVLLLLLFAIPYFASRRAAVFDGEANAIGEPLLCNEPVVIVSKKRTYPARFCLTESHIRIFFRLSGQPAEITFSRAEEPLISYGQNKEFMAIRAAVGEKGVYFSAGDMLANIPTIYETLQKNGWQMI